MRLRPSSLPPKSMISENSLSPLRFSARPGRLSEAEMQVVRGRSQAGSDLLERVGFPDHVRKMVLQHHERLDGSGYPRGLVDGQISSGARILAIADVFEAMASHRPYRTARGTDCAVRELERGAGQQYDGDVVSTTLRLFHDGRLPWASEAGARPAPTSPPAKRHD